MEIRALRPREYGLLREFTWLAIHVPQGAERPDESILDDPVLRRYWQGFGEQNGDTAFCALVDGEVVGIASGRILGGNHPGYGHLDDETPEIDISVRPQYRGQGIGALLLQTLLDDLRGQGFSQVSLSVDRDNDGARSLYERFGFQVFPRVDDETRTDELMVRILD